MKTIYDAGGGKHAKYTESDYTLIKVLADAEKSGNTFLDLNDALDRCERAKRQEHEGNILEDFFLLLGKGWIIEDDGRLYRKDSLRYEKAVAKMLSRRLKDNELTLSPKFDAALCAAETMANVSLDDDQREAIRMCMSHRITVVSGGAGAGKTSMVRVLHLTNKILYSNRQALLCAPTGRAARNLSLKADHEAYTVHRALGKVPDSDFIDYVAGLNWSVTNMIVVDESSMLTLEMLAGILSQSNINTRIVLVGDPNQLPAVGAGNVIEDLIKLGAAHVHLSGNHRQDQNSGALLHNVHEFNAGGSVTLEFDENFQLVQAYSADHAQKLIEDLYAEAIAQQQEVQVLSPFNFNSSASVRSLNHCIQKRINSHRADKKELVCGGYTFRGDDKVILNENLSIFCNGDIGTLYFRENKPGFFVDFGYIVGHFAFPQSKQFDLAYAITIHRSQGSEYDTVILPILKDFSVMLNRNLLYTAVSRAKRKLIIVGEEDALKKALRTPPSKRNSMLVERVQELWAG